MDAEDACQLCGQEEDSLARDYGLRICGPCRAGHALDRVRDSRLVVLTGRYKMDPGSRNSPVSWHVTASGRWKTPRHAVFAREGLVARIKSLFAEELQAGDPLFDDRVWIETQDPAGVAKLLKSEGVQSAILELVMLSWGRLELSGGELLSSSRAGAEDEPPRAQVLAACALARHLQPVGPR